MPTVTSTKQAMMAGGWLNKKRSTKDVVGASLLFVAPPIMNHPETIALPDRKLLLPAFEKVWIPLGEKPLESDIFVLHSFDPGLLFRSK
jgi:hypothetical protein